MKLRNSLRCAPSPLLAIGCVEEWFAECPAEGADPGLPAGRSNGHRGFDHHDGPRPLVLTAERQVKRLASMDFPVPVEALERMRIPKSFNPRAGPPSPPTR